MSEHDDGTGNDNSDYTVGYGKPPKHTQFKPGQSGNRKGRPKGSRNFKTDVLETLKTPIPITQNGKRRMVSTQQAALMRLKEKALSGDARALDLLLDFAGTYNNEELAQANTNRSADDQAILDAFIARAQLSKENSAEDSEAKEDDDSETD